jgi:hypothetical protein
MRKSYSRTKRSNYDTEGKKMDRDTELLKIQVYAGYCHSDFRGRVSYVFSALIAALVLLTGLVYQELIDRVTYGIAMPVATLIFLYMLYFVYKGYTKDLCKIDNMIERVNKGNSLPSVKDMIKGKGI